MFKNSPKTVAEMEFLHCEIGIIWGEGQGHSRNTGGFMIHYGIKNFGFGNLTFRVDSETHALICDNELMSREFIDRCFHEIQKRTFLEDPIENEPNPIINDGSRHNRTRKDLEEHWNKVYLEEALYEYAYGEPRNRMLDLAHPGVI